MPAAPGRVLDQLAQPLQLEAGDVQGATQAVGFRADPHGRHGRIQAFDRHPEQLGCLLDRMQRRSHRSRGAGRARGALASAAACRARAGWDRGARSGRSWPPPRGSSAPSEWRRPWPEPAAGPGRRARARGGPQAPARAAPSARSAPTRRSSDSDRPRADRVEGPNCPASRPGPGGGPAGSGPPRSASSCTPTPDPIPSPSLQRTSVWPDAGGPGLAPDSQPRQEGQSRRRQMRDRRL